MQGDDPTNPVSGNSSSGPAGASPSSIGRGNDLVTAPQLPDTNTPLDGRRSDTIQAVFGDVLSARPQGRSGGAGGEDAGEAPLIPSIATPKGGGALSGIDEKFNVNAFTGTAGFTLPLPVSPGRGGVQPSLNLSYDSGSGNGLFGLGWSVGIPAVSRKTSRGLPRYWDATDSDTFILGGAEDLVPALSESGGTWSVVESHRTVSSVDYTVRRYRPRVEGAFSRIERWTRDSDGDIHWRVWTGDNTLSVFGFDETHRVADPHDSSRVFNWLLQAVVDARGNAMAWEYKPEDLTNLPSPVAANERNRGSEANVHPKRCFWSPKSSAKQSDVLDYFDGSGGLDRADWLFELVFDYGEHSATGPAPDDSGDWDHREGPFSAYRAGFEVRTRRTCSRVLLFHLMLPTSKQLVRSLDLIYEDRDEGARLSSAELIGYKATGTNAYDSLGRPPIVFTYSDSEAPLPPKALTTADPEPLPADLGERYRLVDLDGEGIPGLLAADRGRWTYRRNLGDGVFGAASPLPTVPAGASLAVQQLSDLSGSGRKALVQYGPSTPGFNGREEDGSWAAWRPFRHMPNINWSDPNLRFVDLNGDGRPDLLFTEEDVFHWFPSEGPEGYGEPEWARQLGGEEQAPCQVFTDSRQGVYFADMSGDGLLDLVRVRARSVCYWPNLGYGRFGGKVQLDNAPRLAPPDRFDPARVRLVDSDGTGPTDLLYFDEHGATVYLNQSGNSWSDGSELPAWPVVDTPGAVQVADVLGTGTSALVWWSPAPGDRRQPLRYVDLTGGVKPNLLTEIDNGLGAKTTIEYTPSTKFYLSARATGTPWLTRLGFPVQVVSKVEIEEQIQETHLEQLYEYHHGYYDTYEREFRGFGLVVSQDTETFEDGASDLVRDPVQTKIWFHTGSWTDHSNFSTQYQTEYWSGDSSAPDVEDTVLPSGDYAPQELREAVRALRGRPLRVEVFGLDGSDDAESPYTVAETNYTLNQVQPLEEQAHSVWLATARETRTANYERDGTDPRVAHEVVLETGSFGEVHRTASVAYKRRGAGHSSAQGTTLVTLSQVNHTYDAAAGDAPVDTNDAWRTPVPYVTVTWEVNGLDNKADTAPFDVADLDLVPGSDGSLAEFDGSHSSGTWFRRLSHEVRTFLGDDTTSTLEPGTIEPVGLPHKTFRMAFPNSLRTGVFGASTPADSVIGGLNGSGFSQGAGYLQSSDWLDQVISGTPGSSDYTGVLLDSTDNPDDWWVPSGVADFDSTTFFMPTKATDPFGNETTVTYETHDLLPATVEDARGNEVDADYSGQSDSDGYRVLQPTEVTDPNGNSVQTLHDERGAVVQLAYTGSGGEGEAVNPADEEDATAYWQYDLDNWSSSGTPASVRALHRTEHDQTGTVTWYESVAYFDGLGRVVSVKTNVELGKAPDQNSDGTLVNGTYTLVTVTAPDTRWVGSGRVVYDNKGAPVRQYEPYFASVDAFETEEAFVTWGVSPTMTYDPLGRLTRVDHPHGTFETVVFDPWTQEVWDANDTCQEWDEGGSTWVDGDWYDTEINSSDNVRIRAARLSATHLATPTVTDFDVLGRPVETKVNNNDRWSAWTTRNSLTATPPSFSYTPSTSDSASLIYSTEVELDISGNPLTITDARSVDVETRRHDMLGQALEMDSVDSGWTRQFGTIDGQPAWRRGQPVSSGGAQYTHTWEFDALRRPTKAEVDDGSSTIAWQRQYYGEDVTGATTAKDRNLLGRVAAVYDGAGLVSAYDSAAASGSTGYDFRGNPRHSRRIYSTTYKTTPDWSSLNSVADPATAESNASTAPPPPSTAPALIESMVHTTTSASYDAMGRALQVATPGQKYTTVRTYGVGGLLKKVEVDLGSGAVEALGLIEYDAKGRRTKVENTHNGSSTTTSTTNYTYDAQSQRLTNLTSTKSGSTKLQDLSYTYDAAGNIVEVEDDASQTVYFQNTAVTTERRYTYDPADRLTSATGREHASFGVDTATDGPQYPAVKGVPDTTATEALRRWERSYTYDAASNLTQVDHDGTGTTNDWTLDHIVASGSNRLSSVQYSGGGSTETLSYDDHGNCITMAPMVSGGASDPALLYDHQDRLVRTRHVSGASYYVYYQYDAGGRRARKVRERTDASLRNRRSYVGEWEEFEDFGGSGTAVQDSEETLHLSDEQRRFLMIDEKTKSGGSSTSVVVWRFQFSDHLQSAAVEVDADENVITYEEFYPYGVTCFHGDSAGSHSAKRYKFTGQERDEESSLQYHHHRYYAGWLGRWTRPDPAGMVDGTARYTYGAAAIARDPSGLGPQLVRKYEKSTSERLVAAANWDAALDLANARGLGRGVPSSARRNRSAPQLSRCSGCGIPGA